MKYYAIGDVHGLDYELKELLDKIPLTKSDVLIFMGDVIDRGSNPKRVVDTILEMKSLGYNVVTLMGNHEDVFLSYKNRNTQRGTNNASYCYSRIKGSYYPLLSGGLATLESYNHNSYMIECHIKYYSNLKLYYETQHYIFVHAGLRPLVQLDKQTRYDMLWIRDEFIESKFAFGKTIVYGHSVLSMKNPVYNYSKIGIDTGAVFGGRLTCLCLPDHNVYQVNNRQHNRAL